MKIKRSITIALAAAQITSCFAQTVISTPLNLTAPTNIRNTTKINLTYNTTNATGFQYGVLGSNSSLLNLNLSSYPSHVSNDYSNPSVTPNFYNVNPGLDALVTSGTPEVNTTGSFNYNIPIVCSPGTAGMQPEISINYNSGAANNWLGLGFDLLGVSRITRTAKSLFYDGVTGNVNFNSDDVFALDGQRLLAKSGTYGASGSTYKTEVENYYTITSASNGTNPQSFEVLTPEGLKMEYGTLSSSKRTDITNTVILAWYITKVSDQFGNYMTYSYTSANGDLVLDRIDYTGNGSTLNPYNKIEFKYIDRSDNVSFYCAGKEFKRNKLLKEIISKDKNNDVVRKYVLDYQYDNESKLSKITEIDGSGNQLNPTFFKWLSVGKSTVLMGVAGNQTAAFLTPDVPSISAPRCGFSIAADLNGDGKKDVLLLENETTFYQVFEARALVSGGDGVFNYSNGTSISLETTNVDFITSFVYDEDHDYKDEVYVVYKIKNMSQYKIVMIKDAGGSYTVTQVASGTTPSLNLSDNWNDWQNANGFSFLFNKSRYFFGAADLTGDRVSEFVVCDENRMTVSLPGNSFIFTSTSIVKTGLGDFDGDGVAEIFLVYMTPNDFTVDVFKYNSSTNTMDVISTNNFTIGLNPNFNDWASFSNSFGLSQIVNGAKSFDFGDFNGDEKTDLLVMDYSNNDGVSGYANILKSNGTSFLADNHPTNISGSLNGFEANYVATDVNNDGFCDLMINSYDPTNQESHFTYYPCNGLFLTAPVNNPYTYIDKDLGVMGDFNEDGSLDYIAQAGYVSYTLTTNMFNQNTKKLVDKIFNIKDEMSIKYSFLPGSSVYLKNSPINTSSGLSVCIPEIFVVDELISNSRHYSYGYRNAILHRFGKGFLGFEETYRLDLNKPNSNGGYLYNGEVNTYYFSSLYDDVVQEDHSGTFLTLGFQPTSTMTYAFSSVTYSFTQTGSNRLLNSVQSSAKDFLASTYKYSNTTFDELSGGEVLESLIENRKWNQQVINSKKMEFTYHALTGVNGSNYYKPDEMKTTLSDGTTTAPFITKSYYTGNYLTRVDKNYNVPGKVIRTDFSQHNAFGSPLQTSVSAPDLPASINSGVQYDLTGRFVIQSTDPLSQNIATVYEPKYGHIIQTTGITGLVTKFQYDDWGRLMKTISPTGEIGTEKYEWYSYIPNPFGNSTVFYGIKQTTSLESKGSTTAYYDWNGMLVKNENPGFGGNTIVSEATYDARSVLLSQTNPHFSNQSFYKGTQYQYDDFDRSSAVSEIDNSSLVLRTLNYSYNQLSDNNTYHKGTYTVQAPAGNGAGTIYKSTENNEAGQLIKTINYTNPSALQSAIYSYDHMGLPTQVVTSFPGGQGGGTTSFTYDDLGRRITISDPTTGTYNYTYNCVGQLTATSKPNGAAYSYTYDVLGRLTHRTGSGLGSYTYDYVTSGNGLQNLKKITGPDAVSEYTYDEFNRPLQKKETIGSGSGTKQFISAYTYDKFNRIIDYTYPGNFKTTNIYDNSGCLSEIKNNNTTIWKLTAMESPALPKTYLNSAGIATQFSYDNFLNLQHKNLGIQTAQGYTINNGTGNMLNRSYQNTLSNSDNNEGFNFDNFDRLYETYFTDPQTNSVTPKNNFSYNENGNLDYKDDCGDYVYDPSKPYLLTQIQNPQNNISLSTLNITFNDIDKVSQITEASTPNKEFNFIYGNYEHRVKMEYKLASQLQYTRFYQDNYDREETPSGYREWSYIYSPTGLAAVYYNNNGTGELFDISTDILGSPILLSDHNGTQVEEYSFDAWGRRRNPGDWSYSSIPQATKMIRGYTMHEHLDEIAVINMNGRIYDPVLGRFIQADPFIQDPSNLQNFNRYSYVMNNPLKYTDPSGYDYGERTLYKSPYYGRGTSYILRDGSFADKLSVDNRTQYEQGGGGMEKWSGGGPEQAGTTMATIGNGTGGSRGPSQPFGGGSPLFAALGPYLQIPEYLPVNYYMQVELEEIEVITSSALQNPPSGNFRTGNNSQQSSGPYNPGNVTYNRQQIAQSSGGIGIGLNTANNWLGAAGYAEGGIGAIQIGMLDYRSSLSINSKIGTFGRFSSTYRTLGMTGKVLGGAGYLGAGLNTYLDYKSMRSGEIGAGRFGYRTAGTLGSIGGSIGIGLMYGGPWGAVGGAVIGGASWAGEQMYDGYMYWQQQMSIFLTNFENGLKNGWVPGR